VVALFEIFVEGGKKLLSYILMSKKDKDALEMSLKIHRRAIAKAKTPDEVSSIEREMRQKQRRLSGVIWGAMAEGNDPDEDDTMRL